MRRRWDTAADISSEQVVAIIRARGAAEAVSQTERLLRSGLRVAEVSLTTPDALSAIRQLTENNPADTLIGAGTVLDSASAYAAIHAGASFLVSPITSADVIHAAHRYGIPVIPAASTPTEAVRALEMGADLVKIFPATTWTPDALRDMLAAVPQLATVPTGGIEISQIDDWLQAGATAVGIGSALSRASQDQLAGLTSRGHHEQAAP